MAPLRSCAVCFAIGALLGPALAQSTQITSSSATAATPVPPASTVSSAIVSTATVSSAASPATASSATTSPATATAIWFPLLGISDNPFLDWGVNITRLADASLDPPQLIQYEIIVNNDTSAVTYDTDIIYYEGNNSTLGAQSGSLSLTFVSNGNNALTLGPSSELNLTGNGDDQLIPTLPFGINLGNRESWNGSVVLGGSYDANRIASTSWFILPGTENGNTTFLQNGTQKTEINIKSPSQSLNVNATIDFNNDAIVLPNTFNCSEEFGILFKSDSDTVLEITVPTNITRSPFRCKLATTSNATVILGRPFFQVAYAYLTEEGSMYLSAAHQYELPVDAQPFDANATLVPAAAPSSAAATPTATSNAATSTSLNRSSFQPVMISVGLIIVSLMSSLTYFNV